MPKPTEESFGSLGKPDSSLDDDFELDELAVSRKPHFLDYDNKPPAELLVEPHHRYWNGVRKEVAGDRKREFDVEQERLEPEDPLEVAEQEEEEEGGQHLARSVAPPVCEQSLLFQRSSAPDVAAIPLMNVSYDVPSATAGTLNMLPGKKQPAGVNGARVGSTWPMKERPIGAMSPRRQPPQQQQQQQPPPQQPHSLGRGELGEVGPKMECVYSLLSMLGSTNVLEMSCKFLELSRNEEKCSALRRSGCVPLLVHIIHNEPNEVARRNARHALVNVVRCNLDEGSARRELKVLRLIDQLIDYTDLLKEQTGRDRPADAKEQEDAAEEEEEEQQQQSVQIVAEAREAPAAPGTDPERHPIQAIGTLAKISYDEEHRHAMCQFGALQTIASLIQLDHQAHGSGAPDAHKCVEMRRYASMVLTNLTFGQGNNKALLCANRDFMRALVSQLGCTELVQVTASVLRNLSWRADTITRQTLVEIETVTLLMEAAMRCTVENTLKSILSALWNLSNHCAQNRAKVCEVPGALEFLIDLLSYEAPSKTWSIVENAGGILRNVSSHVAQCEQYRRVLRDKHGLKLLLDQLKSPSLTVVSNACGTLGNLSSENEQDQRFLREHGAVPMLRSLIYSKHSIISNGSRLALKNLQQQQQQQRPAVVTVVPAGALHEPHLEAAWNGKGGEPLPAKGGLPGLNVRKQRALEQELGCAFYRKQAEPGGPGEEHHGTVVGDVASSPDPDPEPETPINYGLTEERLHQHSYDYQETDIDQLTDYSLRYAENQSDSEEEAQEVVEVEGQEKEAAGVAEAFRHRAAGATDPSVNVLMPEDSVKCYYTEGTPQIISSATSMSDLRAKQTELESGATEQATATVVVVVEGDAAKGPVRKSNPILIERALPAGDDLGCNTPDKPFNYCEEGTPDFSRETSLSIIDLQEESDGGVLQQQEKADEAKQEHPQSPKQQQQQQQQQQPQQPQPLVKSPTAASVVLVDPTATMPGTLGKSVSFLNTGADETPLMFSRTSSMGSLSSAEPACTDDKSSIVSEFSRMASGVMSPSELPDSPTQTIPHSPHPQTKRPMLPKTSPPDDGGGGGGGGGGGDGVGAGVRGDGVGAFADTVSKFNVEHTPAQFSCATSLSNLSLLEEKDERHRDEPQQQQQQQEGGGGGGVGTIPSQPPVLPNPADVVLLGCMLNGTAGNANGATTAPTHDEGHASDGDSDGGGGEDDELLASCISIGMSSVVARSAAKHQQHQQNSSFPTVATRQRRYDGNEDGGHDSDDSSNLDSDNNDRLLEECILSGMPKPKQPPLHPLLPPGGPVLKEHPFKMMRTNHSHPLLAAPASDELNPYYIEDSPCNFSTVSALSDLTMASDTMATPLREKSLESMDRKLIDSLVKDGFPKKREIAVVSSPSVESETDEHLLDEAIAAGITGKGQQVRGDQTGPARQPDTDMFGGGVRDELLAVRNRPSAGGWDSPPRHRRTNHDHQHDDDDDDESEQEEDYQLLVECIQKGMRPPSAHGGKLRDDGPAPPATQQDGDEHQWLLGPHGPQRTHMPAATLPKQSSSHPKNVQTTPAMSKDVGAFEVSPGVGNRANRSPSGRPASAGAKQSPAGHSQPDTSGSTDTTIRPSRRPSSPSSSAGSIGGALPAATTTGAGAQGQPAAAAAAAAAEPTTPSARTVPIGCEVVGAGYGTMRQDERDGGTCAKHKDPERMLQSVERLTQELVAQVEEWHVRAANPVPDGPDADDELVAVEAAGIQFKIGEKVTSVYCDSALKLEPMLQDESQLELVDAEGNLDSVEPPSILYQMSMQPVPRHEPVVSTLNADCLPPISEQTATAGGRPVAMANGTPKKQLTVHAINNKTRLEDLKGKTNKHPEPKSPKKDPARAKIAKPVVESVAKVARGRPAAPVVTGRPKASSATSSPTHRPSPKRFASVNGPRVTPKPVKKAPAEAAAVAVSKPAAKPTTVTLVRQGTFVLEEPTLSVHVPKVLTDPAPAAGPERRLSVGGAGKPGESKIPLPRGLKERADAKPLPARVSRIPPPKRTALGKESSRSVLHK
uniref:Adenomatous polyposis coli protein n=1 Tax=Anopheles melas TaxID=34690 RepID=A0A182UDG5_9DIPT